MQTPTRSVEEARSVRSGEATVVTRAPTWLIVLTVMLAVALVALAAWAIADRAGDETLPADEIASIAERSIAAWNAGDEQAILDLYAEDATFDVGANLTGDQQIADYAARMHAMGLVVEAMSQTVAEGNAGLTVVAYGGEDERTPFLAILEVNGDGEIVVHTGVDIQGMEVTG